MKIKYKWSGLNYCRCHCTLAASALNMRHQNGNLTLPLALLVLCPIKMLILGYCFVFFAVHE